MKVKHYPTLPYPTHRYYSHHGWGSGPEQQPGRLHGEQAMDVRHVTCARRRQAGVFVCAPPPILVVVAVGCEGESGVTSAACATVGAVSHGHANNLPIAYRLWATTMGYGGLAMTTLAH